MSDQIGASGKARLYGIPAITVGWGASYTAQTLTIYSRVDKDMGADIAVSRDNTNEVQSRNRTNKTITMTFSGIPVGSAASNAQAIAAALPAKGDLIKVTCADDTQVACDLSADTTVVESAKASYTPAGEVVVDMTIIKMIGKVLIALS